MTTFTCSVSGKTVEANRIPRGWKNVNGTYYCPEAWKERYCIRAIVVPVASPESIGKGSPEAWKELRATLANSWSRSTEAANWALRRLLANDVTREPQAAKCPPIPAIYLYGERDWTGWSQSASAVLRTVEHTYRATRYEIIWRGSRSLPNVKYPYPYPIHNAAWKLSELPDGGVFFDAPLIGGRVSMRLRGGHQYRRQLTGLRWLIEHPELRGEASIYQRGNEIVVKVVGWFPRKTDEKRSGTLFLRTGEAEFLVGLNERDERLFLFPGDRVREWLVRHENGLQRWHDGMKAEMRRPKRASRKNAEDMQNRAEKCRNRINSFIDETAAQCVNHAVRRQLARIVYNDECQTYFRQFPWYRVKMLLQQKCNAAGIEFEYSSAATEAGTARKPATDGVST